MEHTIGPEDDGRRLRDVLRSTLRLSGTALKSAKWHGGITVNGEPRTVDRPVHTGEVIRIQLPPEMPVYRPRPYSLPLRILWEDESLWVIDKPAPLASQSSERQPDDTLENALYAHLGCPEDFVYRPVNRLDKGTSGLMVVAKTPHAQHLLQQSLHTDDFLREYLAVTEGCPDPREGVIEAPIGKVPGPGIRRVITPEGKPSVTRYTVLETAGNRALVRLRLETGRTHQIRVHLQSLGCPVCGDFLYGTELAELPGRFALHSAFLTLRHPLTGEVISLQSPLPPELARLLGK